MAGQVGAVIVHPDDPDVVFVAAIGNAFAPNPERGVFRSRDGGSTWEHVLVVSDSTGAVDLEFAPDDPRTVYASLWRAERKPWTIISGAHEGGVFRSTDAGDSWRQLGVGLPSALIGKSDLAVSPADPDRLQLAAALLAVRARGPGRVSNVRQLRGWMRFLLEDRGLDVVHTTRVLDGAVRRGLLDPRRF